MEKRILGNGLEVSAIGLGCMGFSHAYGAPTEKKEAIRMIRYAFDCDYTLFDTAEVYGTADDPHANEQLVPVLEELKVGLIAFSPMANGFLTGAYGKGVQFDKKLDYCSNMPQFTDEAVEQNQELLHLLHHMAETKNATPAQISMAWILCKKPWIVPIPGTRKQERLMEHAGAAEIRLSAEEVEVLDNALDHIKMSAVFGGSKIIRR